MGANFGLNRHVRWGLLAVLCGVGLVWPVSSGAGALSYKRTLARWTAHAQAFSLDDLRAELIWHTALVTPELRAARVLREADLRGWSPDEVERALPLAWNWPGTTFFIGLYGPKGFERLSLNEENYWHLELAAPDGMVYEPVVIEEFPLTPLERKLFPFLNQWTRAYFVRFAPTLSAGPVELTLKGLNARSTLRWKLP